ncbi:MAG: hypothetical protein NC204_06295 [Candidatus Amulumruptor caecigallinarius]|nr:hypothetical protein [Candidatus Amulumruptor caecigallinarius]
MIRIPAKRPIKDIKVAGWFLLVSLLLVFAIWWAWNQYVTTPPYVSPERFPVRGIDLSAHNGYVNLDAAAAEGYEFVFLKASEGEDFRDANFALNYNKARHAGMRVGAYHYFRFGKDGVKQAENLLRVVSGRPLELGLAVDVEEHGNTPGVPMESIRLELQRMMEYLNMRGHRVTFYSNREGYEKYLIPEFEGYPLWICSFDSDNADRNDWTYWQYNHRGRVAGIKGDVDLNVYSGKWE